MFYNFEDIDAWREALDMTEAIYKNLSDNRDFDFKSQIQRASVSIMNNIAEGFERNKNDENNKSFIYFLNISYGSCGEVRNMTYLAERLGYMDKATAEDFRTQCRSISLKLYSLIEYLKNNEKPKH